ncbi:MAG: histidine triad nucleotide-binding protein [Clostridia bacterium]|nr:MAG: histidine triad nucleotide-binding protein [Clostridia bacterium]
MVYQDEEVVAFADIHPLAPVHLLIVPRRHISSPAEVDKEDAHLMGHLLAVASELARQQGLAADGFRLVANSGPNGGQEVYHLHFHLLGGRSLGRFV